VKSSLASATSLIALLALHPSSARAGTIALGSTLNFGNYYVESAGTYDAGIVSTTASDTATITSGSGAAFTFSSVSGSGFSGNTATVTPTSNAATTLTNTYTFNPTVTGVASKTVTVSGTGATTQTQTLIGTGVAPIANIIGSSGYLLVGQAGTLTTTITNTGNGNLASAHVSNPTATDLLGAFNSASNSAFANTMNYMFLADGASTTVAYTYTPTIVGTTTTTVNQMFANGAVSTNAPASLTATLTATGVAPINSVTTNSAYVRVGTSGTGSVVITNTGNGNLSGLGTASNLNATISSSVGTAVTASGSNATSISLNDRGVSTLSYTYTPTSRGTSSSAVTTISFADGNSAGTNTAQTISTTVTATGVGPTYKSVYNGTTLSPTAVANGATATTGPTISLGSLGLNSALTAYMTLQNTTADANNGQTTLTNLTIKGYSLSGANPNDFQVSLTANSVLGEGGTLSVPIKVTGNTLGLESATLTIFTDESTAYGGSGDTFTYVLTARVPEPAALATVGVGLAGLAFMRRRRKSRAAAGTDRSDKPE
jgi:hypothetical protein